MFGELPRLFDRNFAISFFFPIVIFFVLSGVVISPYEFSFGIINYLEVNLLVGTTVIGFLCWLAGIMLLALNSNLINFLSGYGVLNPLKFFKGFEKQRFRHTLEDVKNLDDEYRDCLDANEEFSAKSRLKRNKLMFTLASDFPDHEDFLLATPFGNAIMSFRIFPRVMYGLDELAAWERLLAIMPKEYIDLVDKAKAQVDLWVNLGLVIFLLQVEYIGLVIVTGGQLNWWIISLLILVQLVIAMQATDSARSWGAYVTSSFDVFIHELRERLRFETPKDREEEFKQWQKYSRAIIYRIPEQMPELKIADTEKKNKK
jgi:hypothetical protein